MKKIKLLDAEDVKRAICGACSETYGDKAVCDGCAILCAVNQLRGIEPTIAHPDSRIYEQIVDPENVLIYAQDYVSIVSISCYDLPIPLSSLQWKEERPNQAGGDVFLWLSLADIARQIAQEYGLITVIVESPLAGIIYRYGNHGDKWEIVGRMCGYA